MCIDDGDFLFFISLVIKGWQKMLRFLQIQVPQPFEYIKTTLTFFSIFFPVISISSKISMLDSVALQNSSNDKAHEHEEVIWF